MGKGRRKREERQRSDALLSVDGYHRMLRNLADDEADLEGGLDGPPPTGR